MILYTNNSHYYLHVGREKLLIFFLIFEMLVFFFSLGSNIFSSYIKSEDNFLAPAILHSVPQNLLFLENKTLLQFTINLL